MSLAKILQDVVKGKTYQDLLQDYDQLLVNRYKDLIFAPKEEIEELAALLKTTTAKSSAPKTDTNKVENK
jgi:hypothetical protein